MKKLLPLLLFCCGLFACHSPEKTFLSGYLNTGNLPQQTFTISPEKDTTLLSAGGVRIAIAKGTFNTVQPVTIEWKEALDFQRILAAGLTTQSGKDILRSGGMFYFDTKEKLAIQKPIEIDVPTENIASGMQLYKGDSSEGKLDWQESKPIENIRALGNNTLGKVLFLNNCASCHKIGENSTGPDLIGFRNRGPWKDKEKYYAWMHNPAGFMAKDSYTQCLKCKYGIVMQAFPGISYEALDSIANYIDEEAERLGLTGKLEVSECDSCVAYRHAYDSLQYIRDSLNKINNNSIDVDYHYDASLPVHYIEDFYPEKQRAELKLIAQLENKSDYYHIQIDVAGWHNIDGLLETWSGSVKSKLVVQMQGEAADKQEVYLVIPSLKVFVQGGYLDNKKDIGFLETNGTLKLPQQTQAFVFAVGEKKGRFIFSKQDFITSTNQTIVLTSQLLSREQFDAQMRLIETKGLKVSTDTTIHFSNLKSLDNELDKMKEDKLKNCGCVTPPADGVKDINR